MSDQATQPDWDDSISEFMRWVESQSVMGTLGPVSSVNRPFVPYPSLETYLKQGNRTRRILEALFPHRELPVEPEEIWPNCIRVFSILLLSGKGSFIQHFVQHDQLWDAKLPFLSRPPHFPPAAGNDRFFDLFSEKQWQFCPYKFYHNENHTHLEKECILPIIEKTQLGDGGSSHTYRITLHPAYDRLTTANDIHQDPSYRYANTYVLKTYRSRDAKEHYMNEVKAFKALIPRGALGKSIIGFHGSFIQDGSYNVLLEYADQGTLEEYLETTAPPTTGEDVCRFWGALFNVIKALNVIHGAQQVDPNDPPILQGWHQDVKPSNILVVSGKSRSRFDCEFKLADLGLSHFRRICSLNRTDSDKDTSGTREYGAPECYRFAEFMERTPVYVKQSVDIWSLGCVFSEVAVWVVHGKDRLEQYRQMRQDETGQLYEFKDKGCFHDSQKVLQSVGSMHEEVFDNVRQSDHVTKSVVKLMIMEMLEEVDGRPNTKQLWFKSRNILSHAEKKLRSSKSMLQETEPLVKGDPYGGRGQPVLSSGIPRSKHDRAVSNGTSQLESTNMRHKTGRAHRASHSREDSLSQGSSLDDPFGTPARMSHITSSPPSSPLDAYASNHIQHRRDTSAGYNYQVASPEQLSEAEDSGLNNSPTSGSKGRQLGLGTHAGHVTNQLEGQRLPENMAGLNIRNYLELTPKKTQAEEQTSAKAAFDSSQSHSEVESPATATLAPQPAQKSPTQQVHHLSVAEAFEWILKKKHGQHHGYLENKVYLNELKQRDHVFLVDDAASMRRHQDRVRSVLHVLGYLLKECDNDGMDLYFTMSLAKYNAKTSSALLQGYRVAAVHQGTSDIGSRLSSILHEYETKLRRHESKRTSFFGNRTIKPLNVYVLTDAVWQSQSDAAEPITSMVQTLGDLRYPRQQVGIQFIYFGDNQDCFKKLEHLDSGLNIPMDIVDAEPSDGNVWKMLLGAINKTFDNDKKAAE